MKYVIFAILMSFIFFMFMIWQQDDNYTVYAHKILSSAVSYAAHDASLQIDQTEKARGRIIFNTTSADQIFKQTLSRNLGLDSSLKPKPSTIFKNQFTIIYKDYIDDSDGISFPYYYENTTYGIHKWIYGPAVIYAVSVPRPMIYNVNHVYDLKKWSVFEYPTPNI